MPGKHSRQLAPALFIAVAVLALAACGGQYPNSTFNHTSDLNTDTDALWDRLLFFGTIVFVFVEVLLLLTIWKFRKRPDSPEPKHVHGNAILEITWTAIPALILVLIAVPTVKTIFKTQAKAPEGSLQVEVVGHQWWWEFRYPDLGIVTANELYLPAGRTVNFKLETRDVIHSFWTPQLGGKRDLITNKVNWLWYTPNADLAGQVFNGFCTEYCGSSHANMRFHTIVVAPADFDSWAAHQKTAATIGPVQAPVAGAVTKAAAPAKPAAAAMAAMPGMANMPGMDMAAASTGYVFPLDKMPAHTIPQTPMPTGASEVKFDDSLLAGGDPQRGRDIVTNLAKAPCMTCHGIKGEMVIMPDAALKGPNLTHFATRHVIAGGIFNNDAKTLARWIKNAPAMKPGSIMPSFGTGEFNPIMKMKVAAGGLDDRQIADIVAYLMALK